MDLIRSYFLDDHENCFADQQTWAEFDGSKHKKYEADTYFQDNLDIPMEDPQRGELGKKAYWDFVRALRHIQNLEPLKPENTGSQVNKDGNKELLQDANKKRGMKAQWERLVSDRAAAASRYRFEKRLEKRADGFNAKGEKCPLKIPGLLRPGIRRATMKYLLKPAEQDFSLAGAALPAGMLLLYSYTLFNQVTGILKARDYPYVHNKFVKMSSVDLLWTVFIVKEIFVISLPLFFTLIYSVLGFLAIALSPFGFALYKLKGKDQAQKKELRALFNGIKAGIWTQVKLFETLVLNLSTSFRMIVLADQLVRKRCNESVRDFTLVLTTVSNIVFDLILIAILGDDQKKQDSSAQFISLAINLINLMKVITGQQLILQNLSDALRDINEHRLSKFEFALLLVKIQEQLLEDDIQYNFVEHLYTGTQVPIEADILPLPSSIGSESPDAIADLRPKLPENLVKEFGHDGIGEFNPAEYTGEDKRAADLDEQLKYLDKPKMM